MTSDLHEGHHHIKLALVVFLTKFCSHRALFNILDPRGPRGIACATPKIQQVQVRKSGELPITVQSNSSLNVLLLSKIPVPVPPIS